ncbi:hypothetical protein [Nocardia sp. NPDC020380]|uniref:hypothetical protein n=1 Tax=Nocardia sp. NPDC020380 TaxID=3364309 RepID=UPI0037B7CB77
MTQSSWRETTVRRVADAIKRHRGDRSAQWLSDHTAELGHRVTRSTISDLEVGRRTRLEVTELLVLAQALQIPPILLLFPDVPDGPVEYLPGQFTQSRWAIEWFNGEDETAFTSESMLPIRLIALERELLRRRAELTQSHVTTLKKLEELPQGGDSPYLNAVAAQLLRSMSEVDLDIEKVRRQQHKAGLTVVGFDRPSTD